MAQLTPRQVYDYAVAGFYCVNQKITALTQRDLELEAAIEALEGTITSGDSDHAQIEEDIDNLQETVAFLEGKINDIDSINAAQDADLAKIQGGWIMCCDINQLSAALGMPGPVAIRLCGDITLGNFLLSIPADKSIDFHTFKFIKGGPSCTVYMLGECIANRRQIFSGFGPGEVRGSFGRSSVYPEWWGLQPGRHDIAINCAIRSSPISTSNSSITVSLAAYYYDVARPLDLSGTASTLRGAGSQNTYIRTVAGWTADWIKCEQWHDPASSVPNHAAIIWMGAELGSAYSYRTKVIGLDIDGYQACLSNDELHRVSAISAKGGVEEQSVIHDVVIGVYSGFGIGFARHKNPAHPDYGPSTVNGLLLTSFWIMASVFRDSVPISTGAWANNFRIELGTIASTLAKQNSSAYAEVGGGDTAIYPKPALMLDYPQASILAQGMATIRNVHIESSIAGVHVKEANISNVSISDVKVFAMMDSIRGAKYTFDGRSGARAPANEDNYQYGCAVLISGMGPPPTYYYPNDNWRDRVTIHNVQSLGQCPYLLRDSIYGVETTCFDQGQFPNGEIGAGFAFYARGNAWVEPGVSVYNKFDPPTDRTYFTGPIY